LGSALRAFGVETDSQVMFSKELVEGRTNRAVKGAYSPSEALGELLKGTNLRVEQSADRVFLIKGPANAHASNEILQPLQSMQLAQAVPSRSAVETVTVTSSKLGGADVQSIPIAITALSQEQLTATQTAGGPDLIKQVPNMTFTKTNFSGYSIQLRGIGTQAISVATDPAVAVAFNDIPFIRNHFFEQEFYDVSQVEVLRGPQGTLYGRNATAGVVNVISAKPTDQFEAMASADIGNYRNRRFEAMLNIPIVDDRLDIRAAGEWTKRDGYSFNQITNQPIDGRDLWSGRLSIGFKPTQDMQVNFVWEHFQESDDRLRSSKQLCKTDNPPATINGVPVPPLGTYPSFSGAFEPISYLSQGCKAASLYSPDSFEVPDGYSLNYIKAAKLGGFLDGALDPYASTKQSTNLRNIESTVDPKYLAKNDTLELNADYNVTPELTFTSQTGFNHDFLWSTEDYNRFNTSPGLFIFRNGVGTYINSVVSPDGVFCDPQVGCANRLVAIDLSTEHAWQLGQEFRLASNFKGPLNFSVGGNFLHYETEESYYVFINALTLYTLSSFFKTDPGPYIPNVSDNHQCLFDLGYGYQFLDPRTHTSEPSISQCNYIDPNPISSPNNHGHNYFLSQNPYTLNSYAGIGEAYYNVLSDLKLIGGVRLTSDHKHFTDIPSEVVTDGWGYPVTGVVDQQWNEWTGRFAANWTPKLDFTDQTLIYGSFAHGYKAGGANPPGAALLGGFAGDTNLPIHPLTFKPEFIDAYELGTKNTFADGALTLNGDIFYYNYKGYQISRIVDRTAINDNFDAKVQGAELEATWEPLPGLKFNFAGGYERTRLNNGQSSIDLIDRTAGNPNWIVMKPFPTQASNCVLPTYVVAALLQEAYIPGDSTTKMVNVFSVSCGVAYADSGAQGTDHFDPVTYLPYTPNPTAVGVGPASQGMNPVPPGYPGFDSAAGTPGHPYTGQNTYNGIDYGPAPNNGEGFSKNVGGNELPNAPHFTLSLGGDFSRPVTTDWAATLHGDFYWQSESWARVFNDNPYDRIRGYTNVNLALILTSQNGWQVMGYLKNVFNTTAITGDFLNSDDSGLTTNVFLTDPRLFGVRVTKNW
ncbi:MAG TPA: TonB-dependent receptor plug domain-containing protein, partial [Terriglobales bacterium]|nr:TonB-dependent receptor plug domain-containing protein [Terriglobales bacterium]